MHDQLVKLKRAYAFEQKLNEDWKEKHERLSQDYNDLNEEYLSVKVNYNTLKEKFEEQVLNQENLLKVILLAKASSPSFASNRTRISTN